MRQRVALRDRGLDREVGVVDLGGHRGAGGGELVQSLGVLLRLVDRDLLRGEPGLGARELLGARLRRGLLQRGLRALRARLRRRDLLGARPRLELVERRLGHRELRLGLLQLRRPVAGLEHDDPIAALDPVALLDQYLLHAPAGARAERDRARLDGAAPLVRRGRQPVAVPAVPPCHRDPQHHCDEPAARHLHRGRPGNAPAARRSWRSASATSKWACASATSLPTRTSWACSTSSCLAVPASYCARTRRSVSRASSTERCAAATPLRLVVTAPCALATSSDTASPSSSSRASASRRWASAVRRWASRIPPSNSTQSTWTPTAHAYLSPENPV